MLCNKHTAHAHAIQYAASLHVTYVALSRQHQHLPVITFRPYEPQGHEGVRRASSLAVRRHEDLAQRGIQAKVRTLQCHSKRTEAERTAMYFVDNAVQPIELAWTQNVMVHAMQCGTDHACHLGGHTTVLQTCKHAMLVNVLVPRTIHSTRKARRPAPIHTVSCFEFVCVRGL